MSGRRLNRRLKRLQRTLLKPRYGAATSMLFVSFKLRPFTGQQIAAWDPALSKVSWTIRVIGPIIAIAIAAFAGATALFIILDSYFDLSESLEKLTQLVKHLSRRI